jgi:hypothetical protein
MHFGAMQNSVISSQRPGLSSSRHARFCSLQKGGICPLISGIHTPADFSAATDSTLIGCAADRGAGPEFHVGRIRIK